MNELRKVELTSHNYYKVGLYHGIVKDNYMIEFFDGNVCYFDIVTYHIKFIK